MPQPKKAVYVRLDADVLDWLKSKGKGYQTRMNARLRALMESDRHPHWGVRTKPLARRTLRVSVPSAVAPG